MLRFEIETGGDAVPSCSWGLTLFTKSSVLGCGHEFEGEIDMTVFIRSGMIAFALVVSMASTEAHAKCVMAGGESVMATEDLAKFMAGAALKNSMAAHGWTPHGVVKVTCDTSSIGLPHCLARQKACS
jgi:hypothetical protein